MKDPLSADTLTFLATVNDPTKTGPGTSDVAEVQYYLDMDDSTPEQWLLRRVDVTPDIDPFSGGMVALLGPKVLSLDFQFYDGSTWWTTWDSAEEIPVAVNITIGFFTPKTPTDVPSPENVEMFTTIVPLMCYRLPPEDSAGPMGGTTNLELQAQTQGQSRS